MGPGAIRGIGLGSNIDRRRRAAKLACLFDLLFHVQDGTGTVPAALWGSAPPPSAIPAAFAEVIAMPHPAGLMAAAARSELAESAAAAFAVPLAPFDWATFSGGDALPAKIEAGARRAHHATGAPYASTRRGLAEASEFETDGRDQRAAPFYASSRRRAATLADGASTGRTALVMWCVCGLCVSLGEAAPLQAAGLVRLLLSSPPAPRARLLCVILTLHLRIWIDARARSMYSNFGWWSILACRPPRCTVAVYSSPAFSRPPARGFTMLVSLITF